MDRAIDYMLKFQRTDANFEIPKLLAVVDSIQKYVFSQSKMKCGDYSMFASLLENEQVDERLQFLIDYGVPCSAVKKVKLPEELTGCPNIIQYLKDNISQISSKLIPYEMKLMNEALF
ncbi:hypothetical protein [Streptococcus orisratti]|uniref:hypothetical protein n=1 Tax=Streptococcus orisratti TaxID=114652 RepID=UPI003D00624F